MRSKVIVIAVALMAVAMLATPVLAIGPENAIGKNPNIQSSPVGYDLVLPIQGIAHGMVHSWITVAPYPLNELDKDPRVFEMKNAFVITDVYQIDQMENQWLYVSQSILHDYYELHGLPPEMINYVLSQHPQGIYMKWNFVGQ